MEKLVKQNGPLPLTEACDAIRQAALGLQHAHEQRLVHRDIKPHNLLRTSKGVVKVLDMGLARLHSVGEDGDTEALTREGAVMGTPDYIAPEQAISSHSVDIRADLYSLGCSLYFLLTGRPPFPGGSLAEKLLKHQSEEPHPVEHLRPDVPPSLAAIVRKLMAKRPEQRYQTPAALAAALASFCPQGGALNAPAALPVSGSDGHCATATTALTAPIAQFVPSGALPAPLAVPVDAADHGAQTEVLRRTVAVVRQLPWRRIVVGSGVGMLVLLVLFWAFGSKKSPEAKSAGEASNGDDSAANRPQWPRENWRRDDFSQAKSFDWPPPGLETILGNQRGRHWSAVRCVAYSPDGKLAASAGDDGLICVWDAEPTLEHALQERALLVGHLKPVLALAFAPDNRRLLSGSEDGKLWLWDVKERKVVRRFEGHHDRIMCVAFSRDGKRVLSGAGGGIDHSVRLWDVERGSEVLRFTKHEGPVCAVAFCADGKHAISGNGDMARRWKLESGKEVGQVKMEVEEGRAMAFSSEGRRIASVFNNGCSRLWDAESGKQLCQLALGSSSGISSMAVSPDGSKGVAGGFSGFVSIWEPSKELRHLEGHTGSVTSVAFSPDGRYVLSGSLDRTVRLWDVETGKEVIPFKGHTQNVSSVALSGDGRRALTGGGDALAILWDLESGSLGREIYRKSHRGNVSHVALSTDGSRGVTGGDGTVRLWDSAKGEEVRILEKGCLGVTFASDKPYALIAGSAAIDLESGQAIYRLPDSVHENIGVYCAAGGIVARGTDNGWFSLFDVKTSQILTEINPGGGGSPRVNSIALSAKSQYVVWGTDDGVVRLWEVKKVVNQQPTVLVGHEHSVTGVAFAPDGKTVAASAIDGKVILWDTSSQKKIRKWQLPGAVHGVAFTADGQRLALANANGTVYILRLESSPTKPEP